MSTAHATDTVVTANAAEPLYLAFSLAAQDYAVAINKVQEIREWSRVTPLPNSPRHIKGVLNLRGTIVPVIDMRLRFQLEEKPYDSFTVVVVVNVGGRLAGLVVDTVSDVLRVGAAERCSMSGEDGWRRGLSGGSCTRRIGSLPAQRLRRTACASFGSRIPRSLSGPLTTALSSSP